MCTMCNFDELIADGDWPGAVELTLRELLMDGAPSELVQPVTTAMETLSTWPADRAAKSRAEE